MALNDVKNVVSSEARTCDVCQGASCALLVSVDPGLGQFHVPLPLLLMPF